MFSLFFRCRPKASDGPSTSSTCDLDVETPGPSDNSKTFIAKLLDTKLGQSFTLRRNQAVYEGGFRPADENEMEKGGPTLVKSDLKYSDDSWDTTAHVALLPQNSKQKYSKTAAQLTKVTTDRPLIAATRPSEGGCGPPLLPQHDRPLPLMPAPCLACKPPRPSPQQSEQRPAAYPLWIPQKRRTTSANHAFIPSLPPLATVPTIPMPVDPPNHLPLPPPCPLRPSPPSASGMRVESFTSGTGGRLMRPGVGIGAGMMREAKYCDLKLIHQIGEGGFGKVYYGHWCGSPVAIKVATLRSSQGGGGVDLQLKELRLQEFQREVTNMSTIPPHPNVLKLLGACVESPNIALITEFCSRGSLYHLLHNSSAASTQHLQAHHLISMWLGVARGMQHLHACRVVHRDLKSPNLLIDDMGAIKIADFGLSRCQQGHADPVKRAMTGALGTFQWMAPEVLTRQRYSEKADVYSFAMVMYECLTRKIPYDGMTALQAGMAVATLGLRPELPSHCEPSHSGLIRDCWAAVPDQRPGFSQIVVRLERMQQQHQEETVKAGSQSHQCRQSLVDDGPPSSSTGSGSSSNHASLAVGICPAPADEVHSSHTRTITHS
ncbi:hypothetical protein CEUSTIGMA_g8317.t1 [Chlamydomonas eustigma]|uniref:Protein kinase domain-containing protein n=1 Tax=Chlamydomonas eustigma TaxID=1157962 RepID=A0A250XDB9_9CHLO|nr:hypothetical protein CEUSTIGMA_g8317.t1 [Chlamydomonas eustigma]|eukprot:GAX80882.1 hypothetical protein CEUSTIGMA_g8317.t1 [Chlamydomonas eustigma]